MEWGVKGWQIVIYLAWTLWVISRWKISRHETWNVLLNQFLVELELLISFLAKSVRLVGHHYVLECLIFSLFLGRDIWEAWHISKWECRTLMPMFRKEFSVIFHYFLKCYLKRKYHILCKHSVQFSRSVLSNSLQPHELQHARPPYPSPTPGVYPNSCP